MQVSVELDIAGELRRATRRMASRWCRASARSATAKTSARPAASRQARSRAPPCPTGGSARCARAPSMSRPTDRIGRSPARRNPSTSAGDGSADQSAATAWCDRPERDRGRRAAAGARGRVLFVSRLSLIALIKVPFRVPKQAAPSSVSAFRATNFARFLGKKVVRRPLFYSRPESALTLLCHIKDGDRAATQQDRTWFNHAHNKNRRRR